MRVLLHVVAPIVIGATIYVVWRDPGLVVFDWLEWIGLAEVVAGLRAALAPLAPHLPAWLLLSLPDGLWVYAATAAAVLVWESAPPSWTRCAWLSSGLVLGAGSELGQALRLVPGTFDLIDLGACTVAAVLALIFTSRSPLTLTTLWRLS